MVFFSRFSNKFWTPMTAAKPLYRAIAKSMLGRYAVYAANLLSMMILARLFTPEVFGTVAAIMVFFVFFQMMAEAGLGPAIINLDSLEALDRDGLFGLTITAGIMLAILFSALSPVFLLFYQLPGVDEVAPYIAVSLFFFAASIVPNALLLREQSYFRMANAGLAAELLSTLATIGAVQVIEPLHALAAKGAFSAATFFLIVWYFSARTEFGRPRLGKRFSAIKPLLRFSSYQFGFNFTHYFSRNLDNILIGKYMGASMLGAYDKAYQLMRYPLLLLTFAMTPAIQPVMRRHAQDQNKIEKIHREFTFKLSLIGAAAGLAMYILAEWIVLALLGDQWTNVMPIIKILAVAVPVQVVLSTSGSFFQALNKVDVLFLSGALSAVVLISAIFFGLIAGDVELLCWALVLAFHINFIQTYYYMYKKAFLVPLRVFLVRMLPAATVVTGMVAYSFFYS